MGLEQSRTSDLSQEAIERFCSFVPHIQAVSFAELPEELRLVEVGDIAKQVNTYALPSGRRSANKVQAHVIYDLGTFALTSRLDLVTAQNAAEFLIWDFRLVRGTLLKAQVMSDINGLVNSLPNTPELSAKYDEVTDNPHL